MKEYDTDYQPLITCPHCGYKDKNSWECGLGDGDLEESQCGSCDNPFTIEARVIRTFTTMKSL
jgi:sarcosine oxidase delta subunit